jgi:PAS domain S-box-containing protein
MSEKSLPEMLTALLDMISRGAGKLPEAFRLASEIQGRLELLTEREVLLTNIAESLNEGLLVLDSEHQIVLVNAAFLRMFALARDQAIGHPYQRALKGELADSLRDLLPRLWETGSDAQIQVKWTSASGETKPLEILAKPLRNQFMDSVGFLVVFRDVSASSELEKLRKLERVKTNFISTVSHELRTPLASMIGSLSLLRSGLAGEMSERQVELLEILHRNSYRLKQVIENILDLSHLESGEPVLELEDTDLGRLIQESIARFAQLADEKGVRLLSAASTECRARLDPKKIQHVLDNLIGNAIKFTPAGGKVTVSVKREKNSILVCVEDTGIGIPEEEQKRIFDKFYQVEDALVRTTRGPGLGLSICQQILSMHRGEIWVESTPGAGSRFTFRIPNPTAHPGSNGKAEEQVVSPLGTRS